MKQSKIQKIVLTAMRRADYQPKPTAWFVKLPDLKGVGNLKKKLSVVFGELAQQGLVVRSSDGGWLLIDSDLSQVGRLVGTRHDYAFVEQERTHYYVGAKHRKDALHGDLVRFRLLKRDVNGRDAAAEVVQVLQRGSGRILGIYSEQGRQGVVTPQDSRFGVDILVPKGSANGGDLVYLEITEWPDAERGVWQPRGTVLESLGKSDDFKVNYRAALMKHGIRTEYPELAVQQAEVLRQQGVTQEDLKGRLDLRQLLTFTIDGADAKDFDDALSLEQLPDGRTCLGVHIADVSHYVEDNSPINAEARLRGTSVYFTDQVVPMLPFPLSDDLCSLLPGEDRLTVSCLMTLDEEANVVDYTIVNSVIRSAARCVYSDLNALLAGAAGPEVARRYEPVLPTVAVLRGITDKLFAARRSKGAMTFETHEVKILVDGNGMPTDVITSPRGATERLVEECMLLANRTVACHLQRLNLPGVYRVHSAPPPEKLEGLRAALLHFGITLAVKQGGGDDRENAFVLQQVSDEVAGKPIEHVVSGLLIRAMSRAQYSAVNKGHYGLAEQNYCHFTSPIRRYPDLLVHRVLTLHQRADSSALSALEGMAPQLAKDCFDCEERAIAAERDIESLYVCLFMQRFVGEEFDAVITGVTAFGLFVSLENTVEGLIHISKLGNDYYLYNEQTHTLDGHRTGVRFCLGQQVRVKLVKSDPESRRIDFIPVS